MAAFKQGRRHRTEELRLVRDTRLHTDICSRLRLQVKWLFAKVPLLMPSQEAVCLYVDVNTLNATRV